MPSNEFIDNLFSTPLPILTYTRDSEDTGKLIPSRIEYKTVHAQRTPLLKKAIASTMAMFDCDENCIVGELLSPLLAFCSSIQDDKVEECMHKMSSRDMADSYVLQTLKQAKKYKLPDWEAEALNFFVDKENTPGWFDLLFSRLKMIVPFDVSSTIDNSAPEQQSFPFNTIHQFALILFNNWLKAHLLINQPFRKLCTCKNADTLRWRVEFPVFDELDGQMIINFDEFIIGKGRKPNIIKYKPKSSKLKIIRYHRYGFVDIDMADYSPLSCQPDETGTAPVCTLSHCDYNALGEKTGCFTVPVQLTCN